MVKASISTLGNVLSGPATATFDAEPALEDLDDKTLLGICLTDGFGDGYHTDELATAAAEHSDEVRRLFKLTELLAHFEIEMGGSTVRVEDPAALTRWIQQHRPDLWEQLQPGLSDAFRP